MRFDGYRYIDEERIDNGGSWTTQPVSWTWRLRPSVSFSNPDYGAPPDYLRMMLFLVQRKFMREGWLRWESQLTRMTETALHADLQGRRFGPVFRFEDWATEWDRDYARYVNDHVRFVERRDRATVYDEHLF